MSDDRPRWGEKYSVLIRCLHAAIDRLHAGDTPEEVFADYGWSLHARPGIEVTRAMRGEIWSLMRSVLLQGTYIHYDHLNKTSEQYSARIDCAASERADALVALISPAEPHIDGWPLYSCIPPAKEPT